MQGESRRRTSGLLDWPVRTHEEIGPGDLGTLGWTVPWMRTLVREGREDPFVHEAALGVALANPGLHPLDAIFRHVQAMPYRYDEEILAARGVPDDTSELLQGAPLQVAKARALGLAAVEGDCDDRAILFQSMAESLGFPTRFALVKGPGRPDYSHVYSEVEAAPGRWIAADTIFNGTGGRRVFGLGEEVGAPEGARAKVSIPVDGGALSGLGLLAAFYLAWRFFK